MFKDTCRRFTLPIVLILSLTTFVCAQSSPSISVTGCGDAAT